MIFKFPSRLLLAVLIVVGFSQQGFAASAPEEDLIDEALLEKAVAEETRAEEARIEEKRLEKERLERESEEQARLEEERAEEARLAAERLEREREERERLEEEQARLEEERLEKEREEQARLEEQRAEAARLKEERAEREREEQAQHEEEQARLEEERLEREREEQARLEEERLEKEKEEQARLEEERLEKERKDAEEAAGVEEENIKAGVVEESAFSFQRFEMLREMGLASLSLNLLLQEQKQEQIYSAPWVAYEKKIFQLLSVLNQWQQIVDRVDKMVVDTANRDLIDQLTMQRFVTDKAIAKLKLNRADEALTIIRQLIWGQKFSDADDDKGQKASILLPLWRQLVIRSYLLKGLDGDALKASMRYKFDYEDYNPEWNQLQARVLMKNGEYASAASILGYSTLPASKPLRHLAAMRAFPNELRSVLKLIRSEMKADNLSKEQLWAYQYVKYLGYIQNNSIFTACIELEALLAYGDVDSIMGEEYRVDGDELWQLYIAMGREIANKHQMLEGDFEAWFKLANKLKKESLVSSRSIYAFIAAHSDDDEERQLAHKNLIRLLVGRKDYLELFSQLYLKSTYIKSIDNLAVELRHTMVDRALKERKISLAAELMKSLSSAPEGVDVFAWDLRKARVLVLQGEYALGAEVLTESINELDDMSAARIDYYLQVVFDLQSANQHQLAIAMFDLLRPEWLTEQHIREIIFWKAESYFELGDHARSSMLYLQSARLVDPTMSDNWAKSARFKAAGALVKAQLYDDAVKVLNDLLVITTKKSSLAIIKQELQKINLLRNAKRSTYSKSLL